MEETTLKVRPVEGRSLPLESAPKSRVTAECSVPNTAYYRRALVRGDIELASAKPKTRTTPRTPDHE